MIIDTHTTITITNQGSYWRALGYGKCKQRDKIRVLVEHLPKGSNVKLNCECDDCGIEFQRQYQLITRKSKLYGDEIYCYSCARNLIGKRQDHTKTIARMKAATGKNSYRLIRS